MAITIDELREKINTGPEAVANEVIGEALKFDAAARNSAKNSFENAVKQPGGEGVEFSFSDPDAAQAFAKSNPQFQLNDANSVTVPTSVYEQGEVRAKEAQEVAVALGSLALEEGSRLDDPNALVNQGATIFLERLAEEKGIDFPPGMTAESYHGTGQLGGNQLFQISDSAEQSQQVLAAVGGNARALEMAEVAMRADYMRFEDANIIIPNNELVAAVNKMKEKGLEAPVVDAPVKEGAVEQTPMDRALAQALAAGISLGGHATTAPDTLSIAKSVESGREVCR